MAAIPGAQAEPAAPPRPRFSWRLRLLLAVLLTHVVLQPFVSLTPYKEWLAELDMDRAPARLPTPEERRELLASASRENPAPLTERVMASLDSVWDYHKPWPSADVRKRLAKRAADRRADGDGPAWAGDWQDRGMFAVAWVGSRLLWQEQMCGIDQSWTMFSPNVGKHADTVRCRLVYADGREAIVRTLIDPEDLTRYASMRFLSEKVLQYSSRLHSDRERRLGYCNLLAHRHARNADGSELVKILLVLVEYEYPALGEDAREALAAQSGPPGWEKTPPFFEYDVRTREGKFLDERRE